MTRHLRRLGRGMLSLLRWLRRPAKKPETRAEQYRRLHAEYYEVMKPTMDEELDALHADHERRSAAQREIDHEDRMWEREP